MDTEARIFKIAVFVITLAIAAIMLVNIIYYSGMTNNNYPSKNEATAMLWISAIIFTITAILWIWSIYRMFHKETREKYKKEATKKFTDWASDTNSGITEGDIQSVKNRLSYNNTSTTSSAQNIVTPTPPRNLMTSPGAGGTMQYGNSGGTSPPTEGTVITNYHPSMTSAKPPTQDTAVTNTGTIKQEQPSKYALSANV